MLLSRIEDHLNARGTSPSRFGRDAVRDPCFVADLSAGRRPGARTRKRVLAYLDRVEREERA